MRISLIVITALLLSACGGWKYQINDRVTFEIRSWNHDPIIKRVTRADPMTFINMDEGFGKDKLRVFYKGVEINGADPVTFEQIQWAYSKDKYGVYLSTCKLENANPNSFQLLGGSWGKDNQNVYHGHQLIEADATTFKFIGNSWAIDKSNAYHALTWVSLGCSNMSMLKVRVFKNINPKHSKLLTRLKQKIPIVFTMH